MTLRRNGRYSAVLILVLLGYGLVVKILYKMKNKIVLILVLLGYGLVVIRKDNKNENKLLS